MNEKTAKIVRRFVAATVPDAKVYRVSGSKGAPLQYDGQRIQAEREIRDDLAAMTHRERGKALARLRAA